MLPDCVDALESDPYLMQVLLSIQPGTRLPLHALAIVAMVASGAGCGTERQLHSAPRTAPVPPVGPRATPAKDQPLLIGRDAAGPIRLGLTREAAMKVDGFTITPATLRLEGDSVPVLRYERGGEVVAVAEFDDGRVSRVSRIRVLSSQFRTPEGVHVGSSAREMAKRYGPGKVLSGEGNVCAVFSKAPGRSFCFRTTPGLLVKPDWKKVAGQNPVVEVILVVPAE